MHGNYGLDGLDGLDFLDGEGCLLGCCRQMNPISIRAGKSWWASALHLFYLRTFLLVMNVPYNYKYKTLDRTCELLCMQCMQCMQQQLYSCYTLLQPTVPTYLITYTETSLDPGVLPEMGSGWYFFC